MTEREEIINNVELSNIEKGNLLQKNGYFQDALYFYDQEYIKFSDRKVEDDEFKRKVERGEAIEVEGSSVSENDEVIEALYQKGIVHEKMGKIEDAIFDYNNLIHIFSLNETCPLGAIIFAQKLRLEKKINKSLGIIESLLWDYKNELVNNDIIDYYSYFYRAILVKVLILEQRKDYKNIVNVLISVNIENLKEESLWELLEFSH